jgi:hypothetical protein
MPRFRLLTVLGVTTVFAIALLALVRPSIVWLFIWPSLGCVTAVFATVRAITTPRERIFWTGLVVGMSVYVGCVLFVEFIAAVIGGPGTPGALLSGWVWAFIHETEPQLRQGGMPYRNAANLEMASFAVTLYFFIGTLFTLAASLLAQAVMRDKNQPS